MYKINLHYVDYEQLKNNLKKGLRNFQIPVALLARTLQILVAWKLI